MTGQGGGILRGDLATRSLERSVPDWRAAGHEVGYSWPTMPAQCVDPAACCFDLFLILLFAQSAFLWTGPPNGGSVGDDGSEFA